MRVAVALLTSPGRGECLERTLASFERQVWPRPVERFCVADGYEPFLPGLGAWRTVASRRQEGFCAASRRLWELVGEEAEADWVFWLEDDFVFSRRVDLLDLGSVMCAEPQVAQMVLLRQPVNASEVEAGGYMELHPEEYVSRGGGTRRWWEHRHHWTTNPSLFRAGLCGELEWPVGPFCEGKFGLLLRQERPEATFGVWGAGDPWIEHIGVRRGTGY